MQSSESHWGRYPPLSPVFYSYWLQPLSVTLLAAGTLLPSQRPLVTAPCLPRPRWPPGSQERLLDLCGVGGTGLQSAGAATTGRGLGAASGSRPGRHGLLGCSSPARSSL